jgi:hypothetical protein
VDESGKVINQMGTQNRLEMVVVLGSPCAPNPAVEEYKMESDMSQYTL